MGYKLGDQLECRVASSDLLKDHLAEVRNRLKPCPEDENVSACFQIIKI